MTAERDRGPEPGDHDRPGGGAPAPGSASSESLPRLFSGEATSDQEASVPGEASPVRLAHRRGPRPADLRQKLDEKAAATDELREALDELRQVLDVDNQPAPAGPPQHRRRLVLVLVGLALVAALVLFMFLDRGTGRIVADGSPGSPAVTTSATSPAGGSQAASGQGPAVRPLPWPGGPALIPPGVTTSGPGATSPGTDVQVAVAQDGLGLVIFERLVLERPSSEPLALAAPTMPALNANAKVTDLQVQLNDQSVPVTPDGPASWSAAPAVGGEYTRATLRYRMTSGVVRVTPAASGRALGIVTPLTGLMSSAREKPVQVRAIDSKVLGISCPTAPSGAVCGSRTPDGWVAAVPAGAQPMIILLQLDTGRS